MEIILSIFLCFLQIGLCSIGGGYATIPLIQATLVEQYHYITLEQFTDIITLSQMTPGPLAINISTFAGMQAQGIPAAIAATIGCILFGVIISYGLYRFFQKHKSNELIFHILRGLKSASVGFILSSCMTILLLTFFHTDQLSMIHSVDIVSILLFILCLYLLRRHQYSMFRILGICACFGAIFAFF